MAASRIANRRGTAVSFPGRRSPATGRRTAMNELFQAAGYAAIVYLLFNYAVSFGSGRPLTDAINPNRRFLPVAAVGLFGSAYGLLVKGVYTANELAEPGTPRVTQLDLLRQLVSEEKARPEVVGAVAFVAFGLAVLLLWFWCYWRLPRDPRTFSPNPKDLPGEYRKALRHFVRWDGGLDYAAVCEVRDGNHTPLAEGADDRDIARGVARLPAFGSGVITLDPAKMAAEQKERWRLESRRLFDHLGELDELVLPVRQGRNVGLCFDVRYGALFLEVLARPDETGNVWLYLFGASLNQYEVTTQTASRHFVGLAQAIRHIRGGLTKG